jgi:hypothetical protein
MPVYGSTLLNSAQGEQRSSHEQLYINVHHSGMVESLFEVSFALDNYIDLSEDY